MSDNAIEARMSQYAFTIARLQQEFVDIVGQDSPVIDRSMACADLLQQAMEQFKSFVACSKEEALESLTPEPGDEVELPSGVRIVHRTRKGGKLDDVAFKRAVELDENLARIVARERSAAAALKTIKEPFKQDSTWIEIVGAKK